MVLSANDVFKAADDIVTRSVVGETQLVSVSGERHNPQQIFALNETGAYVWTRLDGDTALGTICDALTDDFEVSPEEAWQDLGELLKSLSEAGLVTVVEADAPHS
ncbi:MAG: PqqD family protein [Gammaproteobacteria bacterium]|nr:PqqD family protein [Gammaproteobacteria bacterium]